MIRPIAIHLPQFHPIPENDLWWGKGFTEWTNVVKAKPLYKGHYQPHLPADLGFYDMRLPEIREQQAAMAKAHGIYGFCYYHYWFNGRRLLERPVNEILESGQPDFPFMLCWANENWTRRWDGGDKTVLMGQEYSAHDAREHIRYLIPIFSDKRYIRVNNRPVFAIYKTQQIPNIKEYVDIFREECNKAGIDLYLCRFDIPIVYGPADRDAEFDAAIEFPPFSKRVEDWYNPYMYKDIGKLMLRTVAKAAKLLGLPSSHLYHLVYYRRSYREMVEALVKNDYKTEYKIFPGITPSWDNTARRHKQATIYTEAEPAYFEKWLQHIVHTFKPYSKDENFLFINAWNEWAEGNHLEPCQKWGMQYLEIIRDTMKSANQFHAEKTTTGFIEETNAVINAV